MNSLILIVLLAGAVVGFIQGAFKQIANFVGVMAGILFAILLYNRFGSYLSSATGASTGLGNTVAFILIAVIVPVVLGWLASLLTKFFKAVHLGFVNRLVGAAIGIACYGILMSFAFNVMDFAVSNGGMHTEKLDERSSLYYTCKHAAQPLVPDIIIVTDSTEEARGAEVHHGIKSKLPVLLGGEEE